MPTCTDRRMELGRVGRRVVEAAFDGGNIVRPASSTACASCLRSASTGCVVAGRTCPTRPQHAAAPPGLADRAGPGQQPRPGRCMACCWSSSWPAARRRRRSWCWTKDPRSRVTAHPWQQAGAVRQIAIAGRLDLPRGEQVDLRCGLPPGRSLHLVPLPAPSQSAGGASPEHAVAPSVHGVERRRGETVVKSTTWDTCRCTFAAPSCSLTRECPGGGSGIRTRGGC
jgi:hypothetical protein